MLGCSGNAASVETALRANGAEQITLLHVQPDEKSIRCAEKLAQLFEIKQILVPDTVYYPAENAAFYDFSYVGVLPSGSFTVTDGGETVTFTVNGTEIYLETKRSTSLSHDTDILVTEKPQSAVSAPFTILKTNGIIEDTEASLSPRRIPLYDGASKASGSILTSAARTRYTAAKPQRKENTMPEITETKLKEQIAKEQIGSLYFLYGDEKLLVRRNLNRLLKKLDGNFPEFNFQEFPHDAPVDSIADAVVAMPFMAERKCVTVSDLNVEAMNTAELDKLYELLDTIPETTVLILYLPTLEIDPKKSAKWRTFLKKLDTRGFSLPSLRLKDNELEKYVCREAEKANCLLSRKLAERIVQYVGNDLNALTNEVTKLCAFAGGGEITAEQVEKTVTKNMETTVFLLSNALVRGDYSKAYALLDLLMAQREEPYTILAVLSSAYIDMYRVRAADRIR